jgi:hypothetical protein
MRTKTSLAVRVTNPPAEPFVAVIRSVISGPCSEGKEHVTAVAATVVPNCTVPEFVSWAPAGGKGVGDGTAEGVGVWAAVELLGVPPPPPQAVNTSAATTIAGAVHLLEARASDGGRAISMDGDHPPTRCRVTARGRTFAVTSHRTWRGYAMVSATAAWSDATETQLRPSAFAV